MSTRISTKIVALALALLMNGTLFGGIAYLFSAPSAHAGTVVAVL